MAKWLYSHRRVIYAVYVILMLAVTVFLQILDATGKI